jgi:hypothetical protein
MWQLTKTANSTYRIYLPEDEDIMKVDELFKQKIAMAARREA